MLSAESGSAAAARREVIIAVDDQHDNHSRNRIRGRGYCRSSNYALDSAVDRRSSGEAPGQAMGI